MMGVPLGGEAACRMMSTLPPNPLNLLSEVAGKTEEMNESDVMSDLSDLSEEDEAVAGAQLHDLTEAEPTLTEAAAGGSVSPDTYGDDTARTVAETDPWRLIGELKAMLL